MQADVLRFLSLSVLLVYLVSVHLYAADDRQVSETGPQ
jgi:hypothetical protein